MDQHYCNIYPYSSLTRKTHILEDPEDRDGMNGESEEGHLRLLRSSTIRPFLPTNFAHERINFSGVFISLF